MKLNRIVLTLLTALALSAAPQGVTKTDAVKTAPQSTP